MSDPTAPVCNVEPVIEPGQPPASKFPPIPVASDLASALAAINAMRQILMNLTGQLGVTNRGGGNGGGGRGGGGTTIPPKQPKLGRWVQKSITRKTVRIYNPQDKTQFIDVSRVANLTMKDTITGEEWVYAGTDLG